MKNHSATAMGIAHNGAGARRAAVAIACAFLGASCATRNVDAEWVDPQFTGHLLAGAKVFVACTAHDLAVRRVCADQMAAQVSELGATPVLAPDTVDSGGAAPPTTAFLAAAREAGTTAILRATISPDIAAVAPGPSFSIGVGGFSTGYSANGALTDVATGRLMWTAKATTPPSSDVNQQLATLARYLMEAARRAGLF